MSGIRAGGFTLIELMVVITIIAIISAFGIPSYQVYIKKARFTEVIASANYYKTAVMIAIQQGIPLEEIENGRNNIPESPDKTKNLDKVIVKNGVITATGSSLTDNATYILEPNREGSHWTITGTCINNGLCDVS